jgi:hypothetical protein
MRGLHYFKVRGKFTPRFIGPMNQSVSCLRRASVLIGALVGKVTSLIMGSE